MRASKTRNKALGYVLLNRVYQYFKCAYSFYLSLISFAVLFVNSDYAFAQQNASSVSRIEGSQYVVDSELLDRRPGYARYYLSLRSFDLRLAAGTNTCRFRYSYNGRKDYQDIWHPFIFYVDLPTNLTQNGEISWDGKLSYLSHLRGATQDCITKGQIFVEDLFAAAWRRFEKKLNEHGQDGQLCLKFGMEAVGLPYSNASSNTSASIISPYHPTAQRVFSTCKMVLHPQLNKVHDCTIDSRRTSCETLWVRREGNARIKLRGLKEIIEAALREENILLVADETEAAQARFAEERAQKRTAQRRQAEIERRQAEEAERYREWLQTPEGQDHLAAEELAAKREAAARVAAERRQQAALARNYPYYALVTCTFGGSHSTIYPCFNDRLSSEIELMNGASYDIYKPYQFHEIGQDSSQGYTINLRGSFRIKVQNVSKNFVLGVKIIDRRSGRVIFEQKRAQFGVIVVGR